SLTHCDVLPSLVSSEVRKREPVWHLQREPVLLRDAYAAQRDKQCRNSQYADCRNARHDWRPHLRPRVFSVRGFFKTGRLERSIRSSPGEPSFLSRRFADKLWKAATVTTAGADATHAQGHITKDCCELDSQESSRIPQ